MASTAKHIQLAQALPPRLTRFFARYPPAAILPSQSESSSQAPTTGEFTQEAAPSPFKAHKHPATGKWHDPVFSLRRQADLVKLAQRHGVEDLMPFSVKSSAERLRRREENGLRVKGTGVGERVKGKESERQMKGRLEKRRQAMLEMPQLIQTWKEVSNIISDTNLEDVGLTISREDMVVDGRSGRNRLRNLKSSVFMVTYYEVLGLPNSRDAARFLTPQLLKAAYRKSLLQHHPDKAQHVSSPDHVSTKATNKQPSSAYTVDQITKAYSIISTPKLREEYDRELALQSQQTGDFGAQQKNGFRTGVEIVDLDDLEFDEKESLWFRSCRCGDDRGFLIREEDLEEAADDGELAAPKSVPPVVKQALILDWFHKSLSAHCFKDLEKALPAVASISGMVVKDYLQALSDEGLIKVEKIGSGNWYWAFVSDAKQSKEKVLHDLQAEETKLKTSIADVKKHITEETAQRDEDEEMLEDNGMDRQALLEAHERLLKETASLDKELAAYSGSDPTEVLRKEKEIQSLKDGAEHFTDYLECIRSYILDLTNDREQVALVMQSTCGDEYIPGEGLREL
ncbi:hypothetical protein V500_09282 [Pseudogymnoascus sp. VKM F-4518 (FW-2643)]|nr:hypothetical protein V500_09282 [Pseudogymnoascus sp. VKM F-4518 (FW-2643)]